MIKKIELKLTPDEAFDQELIKNKIVKKLNIKAKENFEFQILKRSIDARGDEPKFLLVIEVYLNEQPVAEKTIRESYQNTINSEKKVLIIGAGPAGYFAALKMIELGIKPLIFERGKDVVERRKDLRQVQQFGVVNPDSNYCFGEGGAGTYSDGKLYTRSTKRGDVNQVLKILVENGAKADIMVDARPHIGSNKLPQVVKNIRETIINFGGEIYFNHKVTDLLLKDKKIIGVVSNEKDEYYGDAVILATGHSARDIFYLLKNKGIKIEAKPFALGVRVEHPQPLIDEIQYKQNPRHEMLPASYYKLACQVDGRGVFSFCMCPGGFIVPASTAPGELVINGMSLSRRDSPFANSGIVVQVELEDLDEYKKYQETAALEFQKDCEKRIFQAGSDGTQKAPAQRVEDFISGKISETLPKTSYIPGIYPAPLHELLPEFIVNKLRGGFSDFNRKMKGFVSEEAKIIALESRTSSPVKIPRDEKTLMHTEISGLFPCGEGAGYAGGIVSAAIDGQKVADSVAVFLQK